MCSMLPILVSVNFGMYELYVAQMPRPFQPALGSSMRPSRPRVKNGIGYGRRNTVNFSVFGSNINNESDVVPVTMTISLPSPSVSNWSTHKKYGYSVLPVSFPVPVNLGPGKSQ